jgi:hypothetical protein
MYTLRPEHEKEIRTRIEMPALEGCWIWRGSLDSNPRGTHRPAFDYYDFRGQQRLPVARYVYVKTRAEKVAKRARFHYCPLDQRCVNPNHNYPIGPGHVCDTCKLRNVTNPYPVYKHSPNYLRHLEREGAA